MIRVKVKIKNNLLQNIIVSGHAMYADLGRDIVCSAVSTCVITTVNGIIDINESAIIVNQNDNSIEIEVKTKDEIVQKLLLNMINILSDLEKQYPKNIRLSKEEF